MTLIRLECEDLNRFVRIFVISVIEMWIYWWSSELIDRVRELITNYWYIEMVVYYTRLLDVNWYWCSWWLLKLWAGRFVSIVFSISIRFWDGYICEIVYWLEVSRLLLYNSCYWKLLGKDYLTITPCTVLLFIVYTVTVTVHCYWYCSPCIRLLIDCYCTVIVTVTASSQCYK